MHVGDWARLPFADGSFDLCWDWAALWYLPDPAGLLRELARLSRRLVFVAMPNRAQVGYLLRKYLIEPEFVQHVDERWTDMGRVRRVLEEAGVRIVRQGVLDVPPWPDTVMPAAELLRRLGIRSRRLQGRFSGSGWQWSTMDYYLGRQPELRERVMNYAWLDHARLPWQIKAVWAHHRYLVGHEGGIASHVFAAPGRPPAGPCGLSPLRPAAPAARSAWSSASPTAATRAAAPATSGSARPTS